MFIIISLLVLSLLICVHELGHFTVAKLVGIKVDEFSIGFGPRLLGIKPGDGTAYSLRLLPLGGYVKMAGMEPDDNRPNGFNKKGLGQRLAVIVAGSATNFLTAVLLFIIIFCFIGIPVASNANVIGEVIPGSPADRAGLQPGDRIVMVDDQATRDWSSIASLIHNSMGATTQLQIERSGRHSRVELTPEYEPQLKIWQIGIRQGVNWQKQGFGKAVALGLSQTVEFSRSILAGLLGMITGAIPARDIAGPIGITQMIGDAVRSGMAYLLSFMAVLGINLAIVNMLPIPALDGSRLIFLLIEWLRGRPVDPAKENIVHMVGFALLMVLFLLISYNDLARIFNGG